MGSDWKLVRLGDLLIRSEEIIEVDPTGQYQQITVRMWGNGVTSRGWVTGAELGSARWYIAHPDQFILSKIDARHGAFGLVPSELDGAIVSNDFPLYDVNLAQLLPAYLYWISRTHDFVTLCRQASEGTTNRIRLRLDRFLASQIPLPPLGEQRRIVAHIDALAARIAEARGLRLGAVEEAEAILGSQLEKLCSRLEIEHPSTNLSDVVVRICDMNHEMPDEVAEGIPLVSPLNFTAGRIDYRTAKKISVNDFERLSRKCRPQRDDILLTRYGAGYGNLRMVETDDPFLASYSIAVITPNQNLVDRRYLYWMLVSPRIQSQAQQGIRASAMPDLGLKTIRNFEIPLPPLDEQRRIVAYLDDLQARVDALKRLQQKTAAELDALLPSVLDRAFKGEL